MTLYCPSCKTPSNASDRCPRCGDRMVAPAETTVERSDPPPEIVRPTLAGRVLIGSVVGMGMYISLREWAQAALFANNELADWDTVYGLTLNMSFRLLAVSLAGLFAGAGRNHGITAGGIAGLLCAWIFALGDAASGSAPGFFGLASAFGLAIAAAAAGGLGAIVWPTANELPPPPVAPTGSSVAALMPKTTEEQESTKRPISWLQLFVAGFIAVAGVIAADPLREMLRKTGGSNLTFGGPAMVPFVDVQLAAIFVLFAGCLAGSNTGSGFRYGLTMGGLVGIAVTALAAMGLKTIYPVIEGLVRIVGLSTRDLAGAQAAMLLAGSVMCTSAAGGWLGGQLFPPLSTNHVKRKYGFSE